MIPVVKNEVLRYYLAFVAQYIDLTKAIVATLGGSGIELGLWKEFGVVWKHGWMIERVRRARQNLLRTFPYQLCTSLSALPTTIRATASRAKIDAFHLDLCGTLAPSVEDFEPVLGLVGRSDGRCFAITVAEERRNSDLLNFPEVRKRATELFGAEAYGQIFCQFEQERDATGLGEKSPEREIGVLLHVAKMFAHQKRFPVPDRIERIVYQSDMADARGFWMRSYFFHLGTTVVAKEKRAQCLLDRWIASPLREYRGRRFPQIELPTIGEKVVKLDTTKLELIAQAVGGEALEQYRTLVARAGLADVPEAVAQWMKSFVGNGATTAVATTAPVTAAHAHGTGSGPVGGRKSSLDVQLEMLAILADGGKSAVAKQYGRLAKSMGESPRNCAKRMGPLLARTHGGHRPTFLVRVCAEHGNSILSDLLSYYLKVDGSGITLEQLAKEVETGVVAG